VTGVQTCALPISLQLIKSLGKKAGVSLNPATPVEAIDYVLGDIDLVLVMSVNPGFGGQSFDPVALDKLRALSDRPGRQPLLEIDGGIHDETISAATQAGAQMFSVGSAIFHSQDYRATINRLTELARAHPRRARTT
jgi:ribulose-phosphate 3-epimerase